MPRVSDALAKDGQLLSESLWGDARPKDYMILNGNFESPMAWDEAVMDFLTEKPNGNSDEDLPSFDDVLTHLVNAAKAHVDEQEVARVDLLEVVNEARQIIAGGVADPRINELEAMVEAYDLLTADNWKPTYIREFLRCQMAIREANIPALFPRKLIRGDHYVPAPVSGKLQDAQAMGNVSLSQGISLCGPPSTPSSSGPPSTPSSTVPLSTLSSTVPLSTLSSTVPPSPLSCSILVTETGKPFGTMREPTGASKAFYEWLQQAGGNPDYIKYWALSQQGTSWSEPSRFAKFFFTTSRTVKIDDAERYFWFPDLADCFERVSEKYSAIQDGKRAEHQYLRFTPEYQTTLAAQHAFTFEMLKAVDLPNSNRAAKSLSLIRLEKQSVLTDVCGSVPSIGAPMPTFVRGAAESFSLISAYKDPSQAGHTLGPFYVTRQVVPFHRVFAAYLQSRPDSTEGLFLNDGENELLVMTEDKPATFHGLDPTAYTL